MRVEVKRGYAVLLPGDLPVGGWLWGFKPGWTADRSKWGRRGFTLRFGATLVVVTLPGRGKTR